MRRGGVGAIAVALVMVGLTAPVGAARAPVALEFRPVFAALPSIADTPTTTAPVDLAAAKAAIASCDDAAVAQLAVVPTTAARDARTDACVVFPDRRGGKQVSRYYLGPAGLTGRAIARAKAEFISGQGWTVKLDLTRAGSKAWDALAQQQFHQQVAIVLNGLVQSAPQIQPGEVGFTSFGGTAVISGDFTQKEAQALAAAARRARAASRG